VAGLRIADVDLVQILQRSALFEGVAASDVETLVPELHRRSFGAGAHIFREGDPGLHLHLILKGEVKIARSGPGGAEVVFAVLLPGDLFGELALLEEGALRTADAVAVEPTECLTLERRALVTFLDSHPEKMWHLIRFLSAYIRRKDESFAEVAFLDIQGRVARKLLELARTQGEPVEGGTRIRVRVSQRILAGMVAARRENVNRALSRFAAHGDISIAGGYITVLDAAALRRRS
jgi:CRP/FNR family transcriptional regulator, cyclic AMP receptor protein